MIVPAVFRFIFKSIGDHTSLENCKELEINSIFIVESI